MTGPGGRFDASELRPEHGPGPTDVELAEALAAARELEALSARDRIGPTVGFEDRVMAAIAAEAPPKLVVRPATAGPGGRVAAFVGAVQGAWRVATSGGRPIAARAQAMAFVLLVILATGSLASVAAIGAVNVLTAPKGPTPTVAPFVPVTPSPATPDQATPTLPQSSETPEVSPDASPSEDPGASEDPSESEQPGATDDGGSDASEPSDDHGGTKTPKPGDTPRPTRTQRPTDPHGGHETPEPTETAEPSESPDDTAGSQGGSGSAGS